MSEQRASSHLRRRDNLLAAVIVVAVWSLSIILAVIIFLIIWSIEKHHITYSSSGLGYLSTSVLAIIGVVVAILFAVFSSINGQSRDNHYFGFQIFREATDSLEKLNMGLKRRAVELSNRIADLNLATYSISGQELQAVRCWTADLDCLLKRLNKITMNWRGWEADSTLEDDLDSHVSFAKSISRGLGDQSEEMYKTFDQSVRNALIGLRRLDEAVISDQLLLRLSAILGSLITLTAFGLGFRIVADLGIGLMKNSNVTLFDAIFLSVNALLHLSALVLFVSRWWDRVRRRDEAWAS